MEKPYVLKRNRHTQCLPDCGSLLIGRAPPNGVVLDSPPSFLGPLLEYLSTPRTRTELEEYWASQVAQEAPELLDEVLDVLHDADVLTTPSAVGRYDRHELYFDLYGIPKEDYARTLKNKTVGLVGSGGVGSTCALLLTTAGVGHLVVSDSELIEESDLTGTPLFTERDVGRPRVVAAREELKSRNRNTRITPVKSLFYGPGLLHHNFAGCDFIILSTNKPQTAVRDMNRWTNEFALERGIPFINAGTADNIGVVGPVVIPGKTSCYQCQLLQGRRRGLGARQLNKHYQPPSYGPLNAMVSSLAVNEAIRHLLGVEAATENRRMFVNSSSYEVTFDEIEPHPQCTCAGERVARGLSAPGS